MTKNKFIVSGVVSCAPGFKFNKPGKNLPKRRPKMRVLSGTVEVKAPVHGTYTYQRPVFTEAVEHAYTRHLKRDSNPVRALDMTYHFLKHMLYSADEWDYMERVMVVMKNEIG